MLRSAGGAAGGPRSRAGRARAPARSACGCAPAASATPTTTRSTARRRRAARRCSATRAPGVVEAVGAGVRGVAAGRPGDALLDARVRALRRVRARARAPLRARVGRHGPRRAARRHAAAVARRRAGLPLLVPVDVREHTVVPAACCIPIPDDVGFDVAAIAGCAVATGTGAVWRTAGVRPGDRVAVFGCGGVGMSAVLGAVAAGARPGDRGRRLGRQDEPGADARRDARRAWVEGAEATADAVVEASGGGVDYAIEATGPARGGAGGVPLHPRPRRRRADRDPARGRGARAAGAADPAAGAARARLDLRLVAAGARLPGAARALPARAAAARPADHAPLGAGRHRDGVRGDARRHAAARRARHGGG